MITLNDLEALLHCVKVICATLYGLETPSLADSISSLTKSVKTLVESQGALVEPVVLCLQKLVGTVEQIVGEFCSFFGAAYQVKDYLLEREALRMKKSIESAKVTQQVKLFVGCISRLPKILATG